MKTKKRTIKQDKLGWCLPVGEAIVTPQRVAGTGRNQLIMLNSNRSYIVEFLGGWDWQYTTAPPFPQTVDPLSLRPEGNTPGYAMVITPAHVKHYGSDWNEASKQIATDFPDYCYLSSTTQTT